MVKEEEPLCLCFSEEVWSVSVKEVWPLTYGLSEIGVTYVPVCDKKKRCGLCVISYKSKRITSVM